MTDLIAEAVERLRRERFIAEVNEAYRRAGPDPEQEIWDSTLMDGLEEYPYEWTTEGSGEATSGEESLTPSADTSKAARVRSSSSRPTPSTRGRRSSSSSAR